MNTNLSTLLNQWKELDTSFHPGEINDREIQGIEVDSRQVQPDFIFVAIQGYQTDGHQYITSAIEKGAVCIIIEEKEYNTVFSSIKNLDAQPEIISYKNTRKALAILSKIFYSDPTSKLKLIGVTGTNGKTTITYMIREILYQSKKKTGLVGTICNYINDTKIKTPVTTPDSLVLNRLFYDMVQKGVEYAVMEVSSHALYLDRVYGLEFDLIIFTNLSEDHLDFHKDLTDYLNTKLLLLNRLAESKKPDKIAVINGDNKAGQAFIEKSKELNLSCQTYGLDQGNDLVADHIQFDLAQSEFDIKLNGTSSKIKTHMPGKFNVYNTLAAFATTRFFNLDQNAIQSGFETTSVPGRFQVIPSENGAYYIIDYAHTNDALENVLKTIKDLQPKRIITVFGCGGDRDTSKRPLMGAISAQYSNISIVTSDNPRTENPEGILADVIKGVEKEKGDYISIINRYDAIKKSIDLSQEGDVILIAGKGHEDYQILKDKTIHFDDKETVEAILREKYGKA